MHEEQDNIFFYNVNNGDISFIPIIKFGKIKEIFNEKLDHGFSDIDEFFPTWKEFYDRSMGERKEKYPNYMTYILYNNQLDRIIGVIAVSLLKYEEIKDKVFLNSNFPYYLYLSWIALDKAFQKIGYFNLLFQFYRILIYYFRKLNPKYSELQGATILIRRMRPIFLSILNQKHLKNEKKKKPFSISTKKYIFYFFPSESFKEKPSITSDHLLIIFN